MRLRDEAGNVVLETVLAVSLFGGLLWPAASALADIAAAYRQAENASAVIARAWTVTEAIQRPVVITELRSRLVARSDRPLKLNVTCTPSCISPDATVHVTATVSTNVVGVSTVSSTYSLDRDAHGM